jgi:pimeloyl-ACP methyl ester carboxylesterase
MLYYKKYEVHPEKEWMVFVHGAGGSSNLFFRQIRAFKDEYNLLLVDLRGHGKSPAANVADLLSGRYSFEMVAEDVLKAMDNAGIPKAHLMGISLGTIIARTISEMAPERIHSMILGGAIAKLNLRSKFLVRVGNTVKRLIPYMWLYTLVAWIIMPRKSHSFSRKLFIREAKKLRQAEFLRWFDLTKELNSLLAYFFAQTISIPTLYIMGSEDYMFLPQVKEQVKNQSMAILEIINKCGHVCNIEAPETFNQLSLDFLKNYQKTGLRSIEST